MEIIIGLIIGFSIGIFFGWRLRELHAQATLNKMLENAEIEKPTQDNTIVLEFHHQHDHVYVYNKKTGVFLTQVKSKEELFKYVNDKYANKNVIISKDDMAILDAL